MATVVNTIRRGISIVVGAASGNGTGINAGWFGDGRDGELYVADGETLSLTVAQDEGQIVKRFTSGYIGTGSLLTAVNRCNGMVLLFTGDLTIKGTVSMDKKAPLVNAMEEQCAAEAHIKLLGGLTGGDGGKAGASDGGEWWSYFNDAWENGTAGTPGAGGDGFPFGGGPGGGSGAAAYSATAYNGGPGDRAPIGTKIPYKRTSAANGKYGDGGGAHTSRLGGAGYGGSGALAASYDYGTNGNDGDAIGGGLIAIFVQGRITIESTGSVTACGGSGADGLAKYYSFPNTNSGYYGCVASGGGGGAGGGIIAIVHNGDYSNAGSLRADGGKGGSGKSVSNSTGYTVSATSKAGSSGAAGTIRITALSELIA